MDAAPLYADFNALAGLRREARASEEQALRPVAAQFEALFMQSMLKSMRDAIPSGGLFDSSGLDSYQQMHDQQLALDMSRQGGLGLADVMVEQLRAAGRIAGDGDGDVAELAMPRWGAIPAPAPVTRAAMPADRESFVRELAPYARAVGERLGVAPEVLLAQAGLETGWGKHTLSAGAGSSYNVFNIKAGNSWKGPVTELAALEYLAGEPSLQQSRFRVYGSVAEAFEDYRALLEGSDRYQSALAVAGDGGAYLKELQAAGYATDPHYADKILALAGELELPGSQLALNNSDLLPLSSL